VRRVRPDQWTESFHTDDRDRVTAAIQFACQQRRLPLRSCTRRSVMMTTAVCPCGGWCPRSCARYVSTAATGPKALSRQEAHPPGALRLDVRAAVRCWHGASCIARVRRPGHFRLVSRPLHGNPCQSLASRGQREVRRPADCAGRSHGHEPASRFLRHRRRTPCRSRR
jgi:hypothetical protein